MNSFLGDYEALLQAARNLVRARAQGLNATTHFAALVASLEPFKASEFDDWCLSVDELASKLRERNDLDGKEGWDYSSYFHQGLTVEQAVPILLAFLCSCGP